MNKLLLSTIASLLFFTVLNAQIIPINSNWKYLDDGSNQGSTWRSQTFNDSSWASGNAQLGYGDGDEATVISYGSSSSNKHITYYFRKTFTVSDPDTMNGVFIELLRDDGAIVYINGQEVMRSNMPNGSITYHTLAASTVAGSNEDKYYSKLLPSSCLIAGQNTIAVEVHQRKVSSSDLSFDLSLEFKMLNTFHKQPYLLYPGDNDKMLIVWQMPETDTCTISWGTDTTYALGTNTTYEYGSDHQHNITISGLSQNTLYYYKVSVDSTVVKGSFRTGKDNSDKSVSFYAYGDTRTNADLHDSVAKQIMNYVESDPNSQTFIVSSGDLVEDGDSEDDWDSQFFDPKFDNIQNMLANLPYLVSLGNHGGQGFLFKKYFPIPMFSNNRFYYSFDYGPVHFTIIDQFSSLDTAGTQYKWIENDLATTSKKWKFVLLHMPGWSAGGHSNNAIVQEFIQPLCVQYGVHFVIAGHNHYYSRAVVNGVQHITSGGGGAPLYTPNSNNDAIVKVDESLHFMKFDIDDDSLHYKVVRADGSIIESLDFDIVSLGVNKHQNTFNDKYKVYSYDKTIFISNENNINNSRIEVINSTGQIVYSKELNMNSCKIDIKSSGVYFVKIFNKSGNYIKKVVIY